MTADRRRTPASPAAAPAERAGRVLVVEDEFDVAEMIRDNLSKAGYAVLVPGNGVDAELSPPGVETVRGVGYRLRDSDHDRRAPSGAGSR